MTDEAMRTVSFIHAEITDDLIISFALCIDDPTDVESLTLIRTPKYELFFEEEERGVKVSLQLEDKGFLNEFAFNREAAAIHLRTSECSSTLI